MGANAVQSGQSVTIASLDALYNRLYTHYNKHKTSAVQTNSTFASAAIPISNTSGHARGTPVNVTDELSDLKSALTSLKSSTWIKSNTANTQDSMANYITDFTLPSVGSLLKATDFNVIENAITTAEGVIPTYSSQYSNYTNYTNYSNYNNYRNYSQYDNYSNYSNYTNYTNYTNYSGRYSNYSNYTNYNNYRNYSNYSSQYRNYSNYSNYNNYSNYQIRYSNYARSS